MYPPTIYSVDYLAAHQ